MTGGKDCKVKVWIISSLLETKEEFAVFGEHLMEVTSVQFSPCTSNRAFSASLDKNMKVYDIPSKTVIKNIQTHSPIFKVIIDNTETNAYLSCEN
jgi:WD40 repeat protein